MTDRRTLLGLLGAAAAAPAQSGGPAPDSPRNLEPSGADMGSAFDAVERLGTRAPFTHSFLRPDAPSLAAHRARGRRIVRQAYVYEPSPVPHRAEVLDRQDRGEFIREKIVFSTTPEFRVPAYLHIPKGPGKKPAIVDLHSHGGMFLFGKEKVIDFGANHPAMVAYHRQNYGGRPTATELVRRGYVVITIDAFGFGERRILMDDDLRYGWDRSRYSLEDVAHLNAKCRQKESTIAKAMSYCGATWTGVVAWDDLRTVDYLVTRPEVDPERIGCVGVSMGGYRSLLLSAMDDRIKAACVTGFMSTIRPMLRKHLDTHSFVHFPPEIHRYLDLPDVVALRAPLPLMVLQCAKDGLFPPAGMEEAVRNLAAIYRKAGASAAFQSRTFDVPHVFNVEMQEHAFAWLDRYLRPA